MARIGDLNLGTVLSPNRHNPRMKSFQLRIPPAMLVMVFAAAMFGLAWLVPSAAIDIPARLSAAASLAALGGAVAIAGVMAFRQHRTTVNPLTPKQASALVATGIYRFSRNPMYLGFLVALVGWAIFLANGAAALALPAFVLYMNAFQIKPEEQALAEKFGHQFTAYTQAVRRWL